MTHADDEFLSALLDGEPAEGDAAHVEGCAECQHRLGSLRHAARVVSTLVRSPAAHVREASLTTALRAADEPVNTVALNRIGWPVPMRNAKRRATAGPRRLNNLAAAAALVALVMGGWAITRMGGDSSRVSSSSAFSARTTSAGRAATPTAGLSPENSAFAQAQDSSVGASSKALAAPTTVGGYANAPGYDAGDIGQQRNLADVLTLARRDLGQSDDIKAQHSSTSGTPTCAIPTTSELLWHASLYYQHVRAIAQVRTLRDSRWILEIHDRSSSDCAVLASQEFAPTTPR